MADKFVPVTPDDQLSFFEDKQTENAQTKPSKAKTPRIQKKKLKEKTMTKTAKKDEPKRKLITLSDGEKNYAMSRALVQGDWCFVSGTLGYDYKKQELPESAAQQTLNTFTNIQTALKAAGFELGHTVRVQYIVSDRKYVKEVLPVIKAHFDNILPAATMILADLVDPAGKIEIEVTCFKG